MNPVSGALSAPVQQASPLGSVSPSGPSAAQQTQTPQGDTVSISAQGRQLAKGPSALDVDAPSA